MPNRMKPSKFFTRRQFIYQSAILTGGTALIGAASLPARKLASTDKLRIAAVGAGGKGASDISCCAGEEIVAICDADKSMAANALKNHPNAKFYFDWREMLDKEH